MNPDGFAYDDATDTYLWPLYHAEPDGEGGWRFIYDQTITAPGPEYRALCALLDEDA